MVNLPPLLGVHASFEAIFFCNLGFNKLTEEEKTTRRQNILHDVILYLLSAGNFKDAYWAKPSDR